MGRLPSGEEPPDKGGQPPDKGGQPSESQKGSGSAHKQDPGKGTPQPPLTGGDSSLHKKNPVEQPFPALNPARDQSQGQKAPSISEQGLKMQSESEAQLQSKRVDTLAEHYANLLSEHVPPPVKTKVGAQGSSKATGTPTASQTSGQTSSKKKQPKGRKPVSTHIEDPKAIELLQQQRLRKSMDPQKYEVLREAKAAVDATGSISDPLWDRLKQQLPVLEKSDQGEFSAQLKSGKENPPIGLTTGKPEQAQQQQPQATQASQVPMDVVEEEKDDSDTTSQDHPSMEVEEGELQTDQPTAQLTADQRPSLALRELEWGIDEESLPYFGLEPQQCKARQDQGHMAFTPVDLMFLTYDEDKNNWKVKKHYHIDSLIENPEVGHGHAYPRVVDPCNKRLESFLLEDLHAYFKGRHVQLISKAQTGHSEEDKLELENINIMLPKFVQYYEWSRKYCEAGNERDKTSVFNNREFRQLYARYFRKSLYRLQRVQLTRRQYGEPEFNKANFAGQVFKASRLYQGPHSLLPGQAPEPPQTTNEPVIEASEEQSWRTQNDHRQSAVGKLPVDYVRRLRGERWKPDFKSAYNQFRQGKNQLQLIDGLKENSQTSEYVFGLWHACQATLSGTENLATNLGFAERTVTEGFDRIEVDHVIMGHPDPDEFWQTVGQFKEKVQPEGPTQQGIAAIKSTRTMGYSVNSYPLLCRPHPITLRGLVRANVFWCNMMYLRRTTFEIPEDKLSSEQGKRCVHYANIMTDMVQTQVDQAQTTFTLAGSQTQVQTGSGDSSEILKREQILQEKFLNEEVDEKSFQMEYDALQEDKKKLGQPQAVTYSIQQVLQRLAVQEERILLLEANRKIPVEEFLQGMYVVFVSVVNYFHNILTTGKDEKMSLFTKTIRQVLQENRPQVLDPKTNAQSRLTKLQKLLQLTQKSWLQAYQEDKVRTHQLIYSYFREMTKELEPRSQIPSTELLEEIFNEIIVAGLRAMRTTRVTPIEKLEKFEQQGETSLEDPAKKPRKSQRDPTIVYDGLVRDLGYDIINDGQDYRPRGLPALFNHLWTPQKPDVVVDYGEENSNKEHHPCCDILHSSGHSSWRAQPLDSKNPGDTIFGWQYKSLYKHKPTESQLRQSFGDRIEACLFDREFPMNDVISDMDNCCTRGYVQVNPEPDYDIWETYKGPKGTSHQHKAYVDNIKAQIKKQGTTSFMVHTSAESKFRHSRFPNHNEGLIHFLCCVDVYGNWNMPPYVPRNIMIVSKGHIRVITVRELDGSYFCTTIVWCPTVEATLWAAENLLSHTHTGPLAPWVMEVLPKRKAASKDPVFPKVLEQLPPGLYEYIVGESSILGQTCVLDLYRVQADPYKYFRTTTPVLGFQGAMVKAEYLFGLDVTRILSLPKFLLRYMECQFFEGYYFYNYRHCQLQGAWTLPDSHAMLEVVSSIPPEQNDTLLPIGSLVSELKFLFEWNKATKFVLGGSLRIRQKLKDKDPEVKTLLDLYQPESGQGISLRIMVQLYYGQNKNPQIVGQQGYLVPLMPETLYMISQVNAMYTDLPPPGLVGFSMAWQPQLIPQEQGQEPSQLYYFVPCMVVNRIWKGVLQQDARTKTYYLGQDMEGIESPIWYIPRMRRYDEKTYYSWYERIKREIDSSPTLEGWMVRQGLTKAFPANPYGGIPTWKSRYSISYTDSFWGMATNSFEDHRFALTMHAYVEKYLSDEIPRSLKPLGDDRTKRSRKDRDGGGPTGGSDSGKQPPPKNPKTGTGLPEGVMTGAKPLSQSKPAQAQRTTEGPSKKQQPLYSSRSQKRKAQKQRQRDRKATVEKPEKSSKVSYASTAARQDPKILNYERIKDLPR